ncbi:uncharacterized protein LOC106663962 isoform X2 [Cimex lectularius]|uniref:Uncharacterized protein n=1 Tax=Cimex lectularius TaxID=79782 RepID=A0A8I6SGG2_CIMLE|nr:uncharacterized protein LOC106663962 isoform X2 [Cimex lectularius]
MEVTSVDEGSGGNVVKEAMSSKSSSVSEFEKDIGNKHVVGKAASVEMEESSKVLSESIENTQPANGGCLNDSLQFNGSEHVKSNGHTAETEHLENGNDPENRESNAQALLSMLSRDDVGTRPHSMPGNLAHLWQSLKISNELNKGFERQVSAEEVYDPQEASGHKVNVDDGLHSKHIDLEKLFTPASDSGELTPSRNRKMFASSSFYGPNHPTMEEQVELARRISHSLSDISNKESKGQSMYVNRKKRSVKWVHEGEGRLQENIPENETLRTQPKTDNKSPLKLVMNPRGQVQDITTLRKQGMTIEPPMSPEVCFDLVRDLNAPRGKGAELFAKRRKKSEKWIVDESNVKTVESYQPPVPNLSKVPPPSYLKETTQRVENVQKMNQIQERFSMPRLKLIKSPWEAALEGSVESAFQEINAPRGFVTQSAATFAKLPTPTLPPSTPIKEELYKPKPPRAWNHQPTCKTFSPVKMDNILADSSKSSLSIAHLSDTNTVNTELVVKNVPQTGAQLPSHELLDKSIIQEKVRTEDSIVNEVNTMKIGEDTKCDSVSRSECTSQTESVKRKEVQVEEFRQEKTEKTFQEMSQNSSEIWQSQTTSDVHFESVSSEKKDFSCSKTESKSSKKEFSVDKEVEDLCEREFNNFSLEYENKHEVQKPTALLPGVLFHPSGLTLNQKEVQKEKKEIKSEEKKIYKKPASMVPGAMPLFGGALDLHFANDNNKDKPYEKIPIKSLIDSFELSTRPVLKYKQVNENVSISPSKMIDIKQKTVEKLHKEESSSYKVFEEVKIKEMNEEMQKIENFYQNSQHNQEITTLHKSNGEILIQPTDTSPQIQHTSKNETNAQTCGQSGGFAPLASRTEDMPVKRPDPVYEPQLSKVDFMKHNNFNTAPRGWQSSMSYYRPVTFNTPAYTNF